MKTMLVAALIFSLSAFAGKEERDYKAATAEPAIKTATDTFKTSCGCPVKINVAWDSFKTVDDMKQIPNFTSQFDSAKQYCNTKESKKALCAMKSIKVVHGGKEAFAYTKGAGTATLSSNVVPSWDMMTTQIDK